MANARIILLPTVLSEIDFMYSTEESENKDIEWIFYNGKFSEDEQRKIWTKCFSWTLPEQRTQSISATFINRLVWSNLSNLGKAFKSTSSIICN